MDILLILAILIAFFGFYRMKVVGFYSFIAEGGVSIYFLS